MFLPGAARIPYGNPVHDPIWQACDDLGLPVAVHTHFEGVGIAGPVTGAGMPDFYTEYHALTGSAMFGHFASILCHGVFERFPRTRVMFMEGGLVPFVGLLWRLDTAWRGCRTELPYCVRPPSEYVYEHVAWTTQPLEEPPDERLLARRSRGWTRSARCASPATTRTGTSTTRARRSSGCRPSGATPSPTRNASALLRAPGRGGRMSRLREARIPLADLPAPGEIRMIAVGGHRIGLFRVGDELHALADRCPHRGAPLCSGGRTVHGIAASRRPPALGAPRALLRCPWHKWDFDIASGRCAVDARCASAATA